MFKTTNLLAPIQFLTEAGRGSAASRAGKMWGEGKTYKVADGDVLHFSLASRVGNPKRGGPFYSAIVSMWDGLKVDATL